MGSGPLKGQLPIFRLRGSHWGYLNLKAWINMAIDMAINKAITLRFGPRCFESLYQDLCFGLQKISPWLIFGP